MPPGGGAASSRTHVEAPWPGRPRAGERIVVVSADIGAGHDAAAAELASRLALDGVAVHHLNFFVSLPKPLHAVIREGYRTLLRWCPLSYDALFTLTGCSPPLVASIRAALRPARRRMLMLMPPDTGLVVTTFPFANQVLGPLRHTGRLSTPVVTYVTDFVIHPTWMATGVDTYCVIHETTQQQAAMRGAPDVRLVDPLVPARHRPSTDAARRAARAQFALPEEGRLALIVAGSWGAGDVARTAREVLAAGCVTPVVVCGRNANLRRRLAGFPGHVLGWVDDMPTLLQAVDLVVENAGGLTCQQALAAGLPTITYRPIPGHGRANARMLAGAGLTTYVRNPADLCQALTRAAAPEVPAFTCAADPAAVVSATLRWAIGQDGDQR
ncbi:MGDG synthase family glycosyltransferase [Micromonospora aurantiaca (nom. illeg.)]|uniref:MGDG synthase family glycosyltransferase n=1 Tax=Micromonospora aurantiaca (nom. illeg.) TaxID=47850 RepID=UPI00379AABC7